MQVHLVQWHKEYSGKGLVIIDIDSGVADTLDELKKEVEEKKLPFAVLWDKDAKNTQSYGAEAAPHALLLSTEGKVVWEGVPGTQRSQIEMLETAVKDQLSKVAR